MIRARNSTGAPRRRSLDVLLAAAAIAALFAGVAPAGAQERVSRFGEYSGYSQPTHDGWNRYSVYLEMADGVELAVDYYLPTAGGVEAAGPLPVVLHYTRYLRAAEDGGGIVGVVDGSDVLQDLLRHGYAVAVADARGSGASFGTRDGEFPTEEAEDAYEIIEWLADQEWSNGRVGMHGRSYPGITQYHAAAERPPHLVAIFPEMAGPSLYDFIYRGGTYKDDFIRQWGRLTERMDRGRFFPPAPVEADADGSLRDAAVVEHKGNLRARTIGKKAKFRDSTVRSRSGGQWSWTVASVIDDVDRIEASGVAIYHMSGWYDTYVSEQTLFYANLEANPQKMMIGPWTHGDGEDGPIHRAEALRWFDYWLRGIDNGIMDEPPIHYYVMEGDNTVPLEVGRQLRPDEEVARDGSRWAATSVWPPRGVRYRTYYFGRGPSGTVGSVNDGALSRRRPPAGNASDHLEVDYTAASGLFSRWMVAYGDERSDPPDTVFFDERTSEDQRALTYTSEPFGKPLVVTGYPVVHLWLSSTHDDGDVFVYLEEIDADGRAHLVTEGALRASHRALHDAPWEMLGLPFHRSNKQDVEPLPGEPVELVLDLLATSFAVEAGHRLRVTVAGADALNHALYPDRRGRDAPTVSLYRSRSMPSAIELPVAR